jgi:hypothetical protein
VEFLYGPQGHLVRLFLALVDHDAEVTRYADFDLDIVARRVGVQHGRSLYRPLREPIDAGWLSPSFGATGQYLRLAPSWPELKGGAR